ncbi:MAG: hypothetical protein K0R08_574 [Solimicrobium sp.]|jgi:hypothetical protein|nr:hypothetical protein [Solimicrobium sp.]
MKLFLAGFLLWVATPILSIAGDHNDTLLIASNPYPSRQEGVKLEKAKVSADIESQYDWIAHNYPDALGVVVNGNLTPAGLPSEADESRRLFSYLGKVPYFLGLGDNEFRVDGYYDRNGNWVWDGCTEDRCTIGSITRLMAHIDDLKKSGKEVNADFIHREGYTFPTRTVDIFGSLGYAVDLGKIYFIQLNDNGEDFANFRVTNNYVSGIETGLDMATYRIQISPALRWLEISLEYAAQQDKIIIVNKHHSHMKHEVANLLDKYKVGLRFASKVDYRFDNQFYGLGYSDKKELLTLDFDYDQKTFKLVSLKNLDFNQRSVIAEGPLVTHPSHYPKGTFPKPNKIISVKNQAGYSGDATISYVDTASGKKITPAPTTMSVGNVYIAQLPWHATNIQVSFVNNTGLIWAPTKQVFNYTEEETSGDWPYAPVLCFTTWGTTLNPAYTMMVDSSMNRTNHC